MLPTMDTLEERDRLLENYWTKLEDVPMNPETERIEECFFNYPRFDGDYYFSFPAGTDRLDIWRWFDERHSKGVAYLLTHETNKKTSGVDTACPLLEFIKQEVPFRLKEIFRVPEELLSDKLIGTLVNDLWDNSDVMFDYNGMDEYLDERLHDLGVYADEEADQ